MIINIIVTDKRATVLGSPVIICGNSGYSIEFTFDDEWAADAAKTARFAYVKDGTDQHTDVVFKGSTVAVPTLFDVREILVGVFAGDLQTTTPARIPCERSIRCGSGAVEDPPPSQYDQIMKMLEKVDDIVEDALQRAKESGEFNGPPYELTAEDKAELIDGVLAALPVWEGGSY